MRRIWIAATLFSLAIAGPICAGSAETTPGPASNPTAADAKKDPMVCHSATPTTGSRLGGHRICKKASEWRDQAEQSAAAVRNVELQALQVNCTPAMSGC